MIKIELYIASLYVKKETENDRIERIKKATVSEYDSCLTVAFISYVFVHLQDFNPFDDVFF